MRPIAKTLRLEKVEFYQVHLSLINCVLPVKLKPKEIEVLAHFMALDGDDEIDRFGPQNRKIVRNRLNISHGGLSNYIGQLREKNFLTGSGSDIKLLPLIQPDKIEQTYMFKLINIDEHGVEA